jgi:hypothetical protein
MPILSDKVKDKIIVADARGRVNLGPEAVGKTFTVVQSSDGEYSLIPMVVIPEREAWLWQNEAARASFETGVKEAKTGQGTPMDFSAFLEDGPEDR